jgi:hypothetical protein
MIFNFVTQQNHFRVSKISKNSEICHLNIKNNLTDTVLGVSVATEKVEYHSANHAALCEIILITSVQEYTGSTQ